MLVTTIHHHTLLACTTIHRLTMLQEVHESNAPDVHSRDEGDNMAHIHMLLPPTGVPRRALLYPPRAPRPPLPLRKGELRRNVDDEFDSFVEANAPQAGDKPCWPCPFCIVSIFFPLKNNLLRHIRDQHGTHTTEEQRTQFIAQADICCLVWCRCTGNTKRWEPILS